MEPFIFDGVNWLIFCHDRDCYGKYDLKSPFVIDGYIYVTDGQIALRRKCDLPNTPLDDGEKTRRLPDTIVPMFGSHPSIDESQWKDWPSDMVDLPVDFEPCECRDQSRLNVPLDNCQHCEGTGQKVSIDWYKRILVGSHGVMLRNWRRVRVLRNVQYAVKGVAVNGMSDTAIALKFSGGEGLLMPMSE